MVVDEALDIVVVAVVFDFVVEVVALVVIVGDEVLSTVSIIASI